MYRVVMDDGEVYYSIIVRVGDAYFEPSHKFSWMQLPAAFSNAIGMLNFAGVGVAIDNYGVKVSEYEWHVEDYAIDSYVTMFPLPDEGSDKPSRGPQDGEEW